MQILPQSIKKITSAAIIAIGFASQLVFAQYETISDLSCYGTHGDDKFGALLVFVDEKGNFTAGSMDTDYTFASKLKYVFERKSKLGLPNLYIVAEDGTQVVIGLQAVEEVSKEAGGGYGSYRAWYIPEDGAYGAISLKLCTWRD